MVKRDFFGKRVFHILFLAPFLLPPFVGALSIKQFLGRFGSINLLLMKINLIKEPIDWIGNFPILGIIIVQALHLYPFLYLMLLSSLKNFDSNLEESALTLKLTKFKTLLTITLPLLKPALVSGSILTFIGSFTDLGTPLFFEYRKVIPVHLFYLMNDSLDNSESYSLILFVTFLSCFLFMMTRAKTSDTSLIQNKGMKPFQAKITTTKELIVIYPLLILLVFLSLIPHIGITVLAFTNKWFMTIFPESYSFKNLLKVLSHPLSYKSLIISIKLALLSATFDLIIGVPLAYIIVRGKKSISWLLETLNSLPLAIPGIVVAFAYIPFFSKTILDNRVNPLPILVIAYTIRRLPFMVKSAVTGFQDAKITLEEAGKSCGLSKFKVFQKITIPLTLPHIISGTLLCFAFAVIEVSDSIILALEEKFYPVSKALMVLASRPDGTSLAAALAFIVMVLLGIVFSIATKLSATKIND